MFNNKHKPVDYNYDASLDEIDERQQALNYIAELSEADKTAFFEAAELIWRGYERLRQMEKHTTTQPIEQPTKEEENLNYEI
jgi:hypothetical protein